MGFFPVDAEKLRLPAVSTARSAEQIALVEAYCQRADALSEPIRAPPLFNDTWTWNLGTVEPTVAGPKRPQDRVPLAAG